MESGALQVFPLTPLFGHPSSVGTVSRSISVKSRLTISDMNGMTDLINNNICQRIKQAAKVAMITFPPVLLVIILAVLGVTHSKLTFDENTQLIASVNTSQQIGMLLARLQVERGMTCLCYSSRLETRNISCQDIETSRKQTDTSLGTVRNHWPSLDDDPSRFASATAFQLDLDEFRKKMDETSTHGCNQAISFFSESTAMLITFMTRALQNSQGGQLWNKIEAYHLFLLAMDNIEHQDYTRSYSYLASVNGTALHFLDIVRELSPGTKQAMDTLHTDHRVLISHLENFERMVSPPSERISILPTAPRPELALDWFSNMTAYIKTLSILSDDLQESVANGLNATATEKSNELVSTVVTSFSVVLMSSCLLVWYVRAWKGLMYRLQIYSRRLDEKTRDLRREKSKTDTLLGQIMPRNVVEALTTRRQVLPEYFEEVTVASSDVVHFTELASRCTPFEVVDILNELYATFDTILDTHDVYKVETFNDSCTIVSGLPHRNGKDHSAEIASVALKTVAQMHAFRIPHFPEKILMIRFGIHTGPCAAGVVGLKMPCYCIFGDTVNTASKMESHGHAMKIQLSVDTAGHLSQHHPDIFNILPRGRIQVKGKGSFATWWLVGKHNFPFQIDLEEADELYNTSTQSFAPENNDNCL